MGLWLTYHRIFLGPAFNFIVVNMTFAIDGNGPFAHVERPKFITKAALTMGTPLDVFDFDKRGARTEDLTLL